MLRPCRAGMEACCKTRGRWVWSVRSTILDWNRPIVAFLRMFHVEHPCLAARPRVCLPALAAQWGRVGFGRSAIADGFGGGCFQHVDGAFVHSEAGDGLMLRNCL